MPAAGAPLAEIAERDAAGVVKALYLDIRQTMRVPLVNLIYRHLATEPRVLQWAWESVRPHMVSGAIATQAAQLRAAVAVAVRGWDGTLAYANTPQALALVSTYNAGNSLNLVSLTHLLAGSATTKAASESPAPTVAMTAEGDAAADEEPPPIPAMVALSPADAEAVLRLNRMGEDGEPQVVATLYRHLAVWPGLLQQIEPLLAPLEGKGQLVAARLQAVQTVRALVKSQPLAVAPRPPEFDALFEACVAQFTTITIPKMLPIGALLARALRG